MPPDDCLVREPRQPAVVASSAPARGCAWRALNRVFDHVRVLVKYVLFQLALHRLHAGLYACVQALLELDQPPLDASDLLLLVCVRHLQPGAVVRRPDRQRRQQMADAQHEDPASLDVTSFCKFLTVHLQLWDSGLRGRVEPEHCIVLLQASAQLLIRPAADTEDRQAPGNLVVIALLFVGIEGVFVFAGGILLIELLDARSKVILNSFSRVLVAARDADSADLCFDGLELSLGCSDARPQLLDLRHDS